MPEDVTKKLDQLDFHHPFTPYDVQLEFMRTVYQVLETGNGQVGILESPTGTGKSLSLICASLTWLRNHKAAEFDVSLQEAGEAFRDEPQWIVDQLLRQKRNDLLRKWEDREERLRKARLKEKSLEATASKRRRIDVARGHSRRIGADSDEDDEWLLDDIHNQKPQEKDALSGLSKESRDVLTRIGLGSTIKSDEDTEVLGEPLKIFFTSRTHSQLSQFIGELRRPTFPPSLPASLAKDGDAKSETVKLLPLSSRQKLCINPSVSRLGSVQAINDRCAEMQQSKSTKKCAFVPKEDLLSQTHEFRDTTLASVPDIEDLHQLGKSLAVCPYYASRTALAGAEIVTLPYPLLLQKSARDALGIKLEGSVVIIDEAHNIMDAVANVHAAELKLGDLRRGREMLNVYIRKFGKKLSSANKVNIARVGRIIQGLTAWMENALASKTDSGIVDPGDLTRHKGIDQIDLLELVQYIQESKLAYKIESYVTHIENVQSDGKAATKPSPPVLHALSSFLVSLTNLSSEGRIFFEKIPGTTPDLQLSYLLLSPTHAFSSIASSARAVILAGGTMSPFEDYKDHLFPSLDSSKVTTLSCGHVIPKENLCVWTLASSRPGSSPFEFSYQRRGDREMINQLGLAILNSCSVVPDGVVAFFPSYGYLDEVVKVWKEPQSQGPSVWDRLEARKALFQETKGCSSDEVLESYTQAVMGERPRSTQTGALLLSVVGGKMSEGINFSDRLGRCVFVIGLPYPNIASPEWKAKIEYIETTTRDMLSRQGVAAAEATARAKQSARDFYENACMRAVNQSIGRAIRHRGDYAAIVLVDRRFGTARIRAKLPGWIQGGLAQDSHEKGLGGLMGSLGSFFRSKKTTIK
ncbi:hypothetical protein NLU13_6686 [Sarocladium strictum]|uniref:ATP-dependent DNA helicase CHL1 n=1 Tax=Sarocladium strictum TaxID=5046 RepID=A0AA39G8K5_SARSR|nr:hypothetical protein NLU13_9769 [Sarocladium strictum]KAK0385506.1 hypothetical protein NLU13_6686 [Sarocladium strictum]